MGLGGTKAFHDQFRATLILLCKQHGVRECAELDGIMGWKEGVRAGTMEVDVFTLNF